MLELELDKIEKSGPIERRNSLTDKIKDIYDLEKHCDKVMGKPRRNSMSEKQTEPLELGII